MISDIVLLKELPEHIRDSVEAYIGCVAGASMKNEYIKTIENSGFRDVKVLDENRYPVEFLSNDPIGKGIIEKLNMPMEALKEIAESIVSIKVKAGK